MKKRENIFCINENGEAHYYSTHIYGGLAGVALRLIRNAHDDEGNTRPMFSRLNNVRELSAERWQDIADAPQLSDNYYSFIEVDADNNVVRADESWPNERRYVEIPLDTLLETAAPLIRNHRYSGYPRIDRDWLYSWLEPHFLDDSFRLASQTQQKDEERPSVRHLLRTLQPQESSSSPRPEHAKAHERD